MTMSHANFETADWSWAGCIEYGDGSFESVWESNLNDEVQFTEASPEQIARHHQIQAICDQEQIPLGLLTETILSN